MLGKKGKRNLLRCQFEVVLEVLKGNRDAVDITRHGGSVVESWFEICGSLPYHLKY